MLLIQRNAYANSPHIEFPWRQTKNDWVQALYWIRSNTPKNAVFAIDPRYITLPEVDQHGFRAIAERSMLSDYYKDSGAVSLFPCSPTSGHRNKNRRKDGGPSTSPTLKGSPRSIQSRGWLCRLLLCREWSARIKTNP